MPKYAKLYSIANRQISQNAFVLPVYVVQSELFLHTIEKICSSSLYYFHFIFFFFNFKFTQLCPVRMSTISGYDTTFLALQWPETRSAQHRFCLAAAIAAVVLGISYTDVLFLLFHYSLINLTYSTFCFLLVSVPCLTSQKHFLQQICRYRGDIFAIYSTLSSACCQYDSY